MELTHKRLLAATALTIAVYGMEATLLGTLLPELSKTFTPKQSGALASVQSLGLIFASLITGPVIDYAGRKTGALTGLAMVIAALTWLPHATAYLPLLCVMSLLGLGGGVISTSTNTLASDLGGNTQASMMNMLNVFFGLGGLTTPALGAFLDTATLCRIIVALALGTFVLHATATMPRPEAGKGIVAPELRRLLFRPLFPLLCFFLFLYVAAELGVWNWFAAYLTGKGVPRNSALHVLSFGFAAGIITGRLTASGVLIRFRPSSVILMCSILMLVTTSLMLGASNSWNAGVAVFGAGLAMAPVYPTTLALVSEAFPIGTATGIGIAVTVGWIGVAASSPIIGGIAGNDPGRLGTALMVIPAVSALMIVVSVAIAKLASRTIGIGGSLAAPPLPRERTCGSASGGSAG